MLPYYGAILLGIVMLAYTLSAHLIRPIRALRGTVDRFGQGDLSSRSGSARNDEIGDLARAFNLMAGRIETLLSAERRLLQDVSHELKSPLTRLGFAVELVRSGDDPAAGIDRIRRELGRLATLVDELLRLTRSECDDLSREAGTVALGGLLASLAEDCRIEAEARGCRLVLDAAGPADVNGEPELLRRAFKNVLRNAIRFAPEGTDVDVSLARRHGRAVVTIRDRGPGVPAESLGPIFEPFYRVEPGLRVTIDLPLTPDEADAADAPPVSPPARLRRPWPTS